MTDLTPGEKAGLVAAGWHAHRLGMPLSEKLDGDVVLDYERRQRALARDLTEEASWFEVFCAELAAGIEIVVPDYCDSDWGGDEDHPAAAYGLACKAYAILAKS